jgi:arylsulfatase A-like enzyme
VPALLAAAGYRTAVIGKWHLANQCNGQMLHPLLVGFETHRGTVGNIGDYFAWEYWVDGVSQGLETTYATTKVVDEALAVIASFGEQPWFVQVAFQAPHKPIHQPPPELTGITLQADSPPSLGFRAVIEALDTELGRLLASLAPEVLRNTVVIVMSDNGTPGSLVQDQVFKPAKGSVHEHGSRVPLIIAGPRVPAGVQRFGLVQEVDVAMTVLDLAGAELPTRDGLSVLPYLLGRLPGSPRLAALADRREPNGTSGSFVLLQRSIRSERHRLVNDQLALTSGDGWMLKAMIGVQEQLVHTPYAADEQAVFDALKAQLLAVYGE